MHKDALGRPIEIGDTVLYIRATRSSFNLYTRKVTSKSRYQLGLDGGSNTVPAYNVVVIDAQIKDNRETYLEYYI